MAKNNKAEPVYFVNSGLTVTEDTASLTLRVSDKRYELGVASYLPNWTVAFSWNCFRLADLTWGKWNFSGINFSERKLWLEDLNAMLKLANTVVRNLDSDENEDPLHVYESIMGIKWFVEVINDPRISQFITPDEVAPKEWSMFRALGTNEDQSTGEFEVAAVMAESQRDAMQALSEYLAAGDNQDKMMAWRRNKMRIEEYVPQFSPAFWWLTFVEKVGYLNSIVNKTANNEPVGNGSK